MYGQKEVQKEDVQPAQVTRAIGRVYAGRGIDWRVRDTVNCTVYTDHSLSCRLQVWPQARAGRVLLLTWRGDPRARQEKAKIDRSTWQQEKVKVIFNFHSTCVLVGLVYTLQYPLCVCAPSLPGEQYQLIRQNCHSFTLRLKKSCYNFVIIGKLVHNFNLRPNMLDQICWRVIPGCCQVLWKYIFVFQ